MTLTLSEECLFKTALDNVSGTADRNGTVIDTAGFDSCMFMIHLGAIAAGAVTSVKAQQDSDPAMGAAADLEGTSVTIADDDDNQLKFIDIHQPRERFLRLVVDKNGVNACEESAVAILYNGRKQRAVTQAADETEGERHTAPAEGTA